MSLYSENQRNQKQTASKYLGKYNRKIRRLDSKMKVSDGYSGLEKALTETDKKYLKDMLKEEIREKKSQIDYESPQIEVILNNGSDFVLPVTKSNIKSRDSFAYMLYTYFQDSSRKEDKFGNYIIVKASEKDVYRLTGNISKIQALRNVTVANGFSFDYSRFPKNGGGGKKPNNKLRELSEEDKQRICELREKGVIDSEKIKEELGLKCGKMQIAGVIAAYARKKEV